MERESGSANGPQANGNPAAEPGERAEPAVPAEPGSPAEPRQRWRVAFRCAPTDEPDSRRDLLAAWLDRLAATGLPFPSRGTGRGRQALVLGAPLPLGMAAERELADLVLAERLPAWRVREAVEASLPRGYELVELGDVWLGAPPLAGAVAGADYRLTLASDTDPGPERLREGADALLVEPSLPRVREKGGRDVVYDLRPLLAGIEIVGGPPTILLIRVRFDPERGSGRPEEVLGALADRIGRPLTAETIVRERLLLTDEVHQPTADEAPPARVPSGAAV